MKQNIETINKAIIQYGFNGYGFVSTNNKTFEKDLLEANLTHIKLSALYESNKSANIYILMNLKKGTLLPHTDNDTINTILSKYESKGNCTNVLNNVNNHLENFIKYISKGECLTDINLSNNNNKTYENILNFNSGCIMINESNSKNESSMYKRYSAMYLMVEGVSNSDIDGIYVNKFGIEQNVDYDENFGGFVNMSKSEIMERRKVIDMIKSGQFQKNNSEAFKNALYNSTKSEFLSEYTIQEFDEMQTYKLNGYDIGYAIKSDGDIVSVFNNSGIKKISKFLIQNAIENGGTKLDHFDGELSNIYSRLGFKEYMRYKWDDQYAPKNWNYAKYGKPDVIF